MTTLETPNSSNIKKIEYEDNKLFVEFKQGGRYSYDNVPEELFKEAQKASSAGRWFFARIKGKFPCVRLR